MKLRWSLILPLILAGPVSARTVTLTAEDCDQIAAISALAPRLSWAMDLRSPGVYNSQRVIRWTDKNALLMRFPFTDLIPKDQRVTKAELTVLPEYVSGVSEIHLRRILVEWGSGVCHQYRMTAPQKVEWTEPGCRGVSTDRANKISAVLKYTKQVEETVDVTEDVELWYTGAVPNHGWIFTRETGGSVYLYSPYGPYGGSGTKWKLKITYEPR